jgi:hypothetical protein
MRILIIALAASLGFAMNADAQALSTTSLADSISAMQSVGRYIVARYGNDLVLNPAVRCASARPCRAEQPSPQLAAGGDARRKRLLAALSQELGGIRVGSRAEALGCDTATRVCRVHGAARFFEVNEPTFVGDTAVVRIHFCESNRRLLRQQADIIHLARGSASTWAVARREAYGLGAK